MIKLLKDLRQVASAPQATAIDSVITHRLGIQQECHLNFTKAGRKLAEILNLSVSQVTTHWV